MSPGDLIRRVLFLIVLALFPVFFLAPAAIFVVVADAILNTGWWMPALAAAVWLARRSRAAWRAGEPGEPAPRLPIPPVAGDPLWDLAERAARQVGTPVPSAIELMTDPNAEVEAKNGGVVLRIGLPLLACCPADEMVAVVAHELGHASLGHLSSWEFERRWLTAAVRLAAGWKPGFQRFSLLLHLKLAHLVLLPDRRADEAEADRLATDSTSADGFASALLRTRSVASSWQRGTEFFFGVPRLAGLHSSWLAGLRDLAEGAAVSGALELAADGAWETHPGTRRRLQMAGSELAATALAPAGQAELAMPWRDLLEAERALDDSPSARYPQVPWDRAWHPGISVALRDIVHDSALAWALPAPTARDLIARLVQRADPGDPPPEDLLLAVGALAAAQQGLVRFEWRDATGIADLSSGLATITATARDASGEAVLAPLAQVPATRFAERLAAIGVDLDGALDLSRGLDEPATVRALLAGCKLVRRRTTIALPDGLGGQKGWHTVLLNTGVAMVPARPVPTVDAYLDQIADALGEVSRVGWRPDTDTIWIPREDVSGVKLAKWRSRIMITTTSGAVAFTVDPAHFDPEPFLGLWGEEKVSS